MAENFERIQQTQSHINNKEVGIIKIAVAFGEQIKNKLPELADEYIKGNTAEELLKTFDIQKLFGITSVSVARSALQNALFGTKEYAGLISDPHVVAEVRIRHQSASSSKVGKITMKKKSGIFGMDEKAKNDAREKGGKSLQQSQRGIHSQTHHDHIKFGTKSVESRGLTPFSDEELKLIISLSTQPEYQISNGKRINASKIAEEVNLKIHGGKKIRSNDSVTNIFIKQRKDQQKEIGEKI